MLACISSDKPSTPPLISPNCCCKLWKWPSFLTIASTKEFLTCSKSLLNESLTCSNSLLNLSLLDVSADFLLNSSNNSRVNKECSCIKVERILSISCISSRLLAWALSWVRSLVVRTSCSTSRNFVSKRVNWASKFCVELSGGLTVVTSPLSSSVWALITAWICSIVIPGLLSSDAIVLSLSANCLSLSSLSLPLSSAIDVLSLPLSSAVDVLSLALSSWICCLSLLSPSVSVLRLSISAVILASLSTSNLEWSSLINSRTSLIPSTDTSSFFANSSAIDLLVFCISSNNCLKPANISAFNGSSPGDTGSCLNKLNSCLKEFNTLGSIGSDFFSSILVLNSNICFSNCLILASYSVLSLASSLSISSFVLELSLFFRSSIFLSNSVRIPFNASSNFLTSVWRSSICLSVSLLNCSISFLSLSADWEFNVVNFPVSSFKIASFFDGSDNFLISSSVLSLNDSSFCILIFRASISAINCWLSSEGSLSLSSLPLPLSLVSLVSLVSLGGVVPLIPLNFWISRLIISINLTKSSSLSCPSKSLT